MEKLRHLYINQGGTEEVSPKVVSDLLEISEKEFDATSDLVGNLRCSGITKKKTLEKIDSKFGNLKIIVNGVLITKGNGIITFSKEPSLWNIGDSVTVYFSPTDTFKSSTINGVASSSTSRTFAVTTQTTTIEAEYSINIAKLEIAPQEDYGECLDNKSKDYKFNLRAYKSSGELIEDDLEDFGSVVWSLDYQDPKYYTADSNGMVNIDGFPSDIAPLCSKPKFVRAFTVQEGDKLIFSTTIKTVNFPKVYLSAVNSSKQIVEKLTVRDYDGRLDGEYVVTDASIRKIAVASDNQDIEVEIVRDTFIQLSSPSATSVTVNVIADAQLRSQTLFANYKDDKGSSVLASCDVVINTPFANGDFAIMTKDTNPNILAKFVSAGLTANENYMTKSEAEAVTDAKFPSLNSVSATSFTEYQYFTGLTTAKNLKFATALSKLILPEGLTTMNDTFSYGQIVNKIVYPSTLNKIVGATSTFWGFDTQDIVIPNADMLANIEYTSPDNGNSSILWPSRYKSARVHIGNKIDVIELSSSVKELKAGALRCLRSEAKVVIPTSVINIGSYCFSESLCNVYYQGTLDQWNAIEKGNAESTPTKLFVNARLVNGEWTGDKVE